MSVVIIRVFKNMRWCFAKTEELLEIMHLEHLKYSLWIILIWMLTFSNSVSISRSRGFFALITLLQLLLKKSPYAFCYFPRTQNLNIQNYFTNEKRKMV